MAYTDMRQFVAKLDDLAHLLHRVDDEAVEPGALLGGAVHARHDRRPRHGPDVVGDALLDVLDRLADDLLVERVARGAHEEEVVEKSAVIRWPEPPCNLPVDEEEILTSPTFEVFPKNSVKGFQERIRFASAFAVVIILLGFTGASHKETFTEISSTVYPAIQETGSFITASVFIPKFDTYRVVVFGASLKDVGSGYVSWFSKNISRLTGEVSNGVYAAHRSAVRVVHSLGEQLGRRFVRSDSSIVQKELETSHNSSIPKNPRQGLVVVPSSDSNEQVKEQVKQSFSDEVTVIPQDDESGIITPVFRDTKGDDYFYILVPLPEAN